jgi:glycosyltransferase involved in cell wall biosynthesis
LIRSLDPAAGGPVELLIQLAKVQAGAGAAMEIAAIDPPGTPWSDALPVPVHNVGPGRGSHGAAPGLAAFLGREAGRFDALFVHGLWQAHGAATRTAALETNRPYFVFPHGMLDRQFKRLYPVKHLKKLLYWWIAERAVLRDAAAVLFTCKGEEIMAEGTFWPGPYRRAIVGLGTPEPPAGPEALRAAFYDRVPEMRGKRFLLFLGRLHHKKGCDLLVEAYRRVRPGIPLLMAGPGLESEFGQALRRAALGLDIHFPGMLEGEAKWGALAAAEAFVLPSHQENFGLAVVEALASRCPVLISDKINLAGEIAGDGAGLVEADTVEGAAALLRHWQAGTTGALRDRARACFDRRYQIRSTAEALAGL